MLNKGNDGLTAREEQQNYKGSPEISVDSEAGAVPHGQRVLAIQTVNVTNGACRCPANQEKKNGIHQHFEPQRKFQCLFGTSLKVSQYISFT